MLTLARIALIEEITAKECYLDSNNKFQEGLLFGLRRALDILNQFNDVDSSIGHV